MGDTSLRTLKDRAAELCEKERRRLMERFEARKYLRGQTIIEQGRGSEGLFLIESGTAEVVRDGRDIASLEEGEMFGEISLLLRSDATATVRAATNARVLLLSRALFNELIMTHPQILELVSDLEEARLELPEHRASLPRALVSDSDGGSAFL